MLQAEKLISEIKKKNKRAIARAITLVESSEELSDSFLDQIFSMTGKSYRIGITGPPGAGKSSITNQLTKFYRAQNKTVGIIAVDPTSPFTGGALLGDRVRMNDIGRDEGVYIRSMATRGSLGGLSKRAVDAADILDAAEFDFIIFETVGVGQSELDIVKAADTTIVILVPESGDAVQAMKAGLMEIADFFIVNKADRPGAEQAISAIKTILMMRDHDAESWLPNIIKTVATENKGIEDVAEEIQRHQDFMNSKNRLNENRFSKFQNRVKEIVESKLIKDFWNGGKEFESLVTSNQFENDRFSPYNIANKMISQFKTKLAERKNK